MKIPINQTKAAILAAIDDFLSLSHMKKTNQEYKQLDDKITSILDKCSHTDNGLEIHSMLTLSTAHIDQKTRDILTHTARDEGLDTINIPVYEKAGYGWFIPINNIIPGKSTPSLTACIITALMSGCDWLCLDADGPTIADIPIYE